MDQSESMRNDQESILETVSVENQHSCEQSGNNKQRRYKWTAQETRQYMIFIDKSRSILNTRDKKSKQKVYNRMAEIVKTRTSRQCKSHHQKLILKLKNIDKILIKLTKQLEHEETSTQIEPLSSSPNLQSEDFFTIEDFKPQYFSETQLKMDRQIQLKEHDWPFISCGRDRWDQFEDLDDIQRFLCSYDHYLC